MNDKLKKILQDLYVKVTDKPRLVVETFNNYFGEDNVDFQNFIDFNYFTYVVKNMLGSDFLSSAPSKCLKNYTEEEIEDISNFLFYDYATKHIQDAIYTMNGSIKILVLFPRLKVSNEYDKSIDITNLFVKVQIDYDGTMMGTFSLNRSEYTIIQYLSDYMHSHVPGINYDNPSNFLTPCLGTGPIRNTLGSLINECDINLWELFCFELDKYVRTESLEGIPHRRLENVGNITDERIHKELYIINNIGEYEMPSNIFKPFIIHLLKSKILRYCFKNGKYFIGMSSIECIATISNEFIKWYNDKFNRNIYNYKYKKLSMRNTIIPVHIINNNIFKIMDNSRYAEMYKNIHNNIEICKFKGNPVTLNIINNTKESLNNYVILNIDIISYIITQILKVLNYEYGNNNSTNGSNKRKIYI